MNKTIVGLLFGLTLSAAAWAQNAMPVMELSAGFHRIEAEVAATDPNRQLGLMNRKAMPTQRGMLFVFTHDNTHCMWMRNTLLPLSVAFMDGDGKIINIEDMQPQTEDNHCARRPARYALEMNLGWFAQRGIKPGVKLGGLDKAPRPQ
ncbi:MAG: DUF192 domain-containing protein [Gammaproteobacteria bacterium]|nr:DUF192 domain-containing protein [Gammaproteobacteria bacterium]MBU1601233.1 DUF192 domain-containing protein [Gammaproteobacteria bacterium]MBU2433815.1 DUF192 domain-containing protein [Gammaproteobacteria bacterium]MBU2450668.1 DUF192 domain-containing protein [Gammaproteobacteria bacterium]